jgi:hypothetical protein
MHKSWSIPVAQALQRHTGSWKAPIEKPNIPEHSPQAALVPACGEHEDASAGSERPALAPG